MTGNFRFKAAEIGVFNTKHSDDALVSFDKGCNIVGLTMGEFSLIDLIKSTLEKTGPADVYIATWSAGIKDAHQVKWMVDSKLINKLCLLTDHSYVNRQKKYAASITELFGAENIRTSEMHAKFVVIKNADYNVTIISSMNLNANKTCETFTIHENKEVTDFYMGFVNHHFNNMENGFERSSTIVNKCLKSFFDKQTKETSVNKEIKLIKHWSEQ
jgi:hypothetical protein